ncbi:MAG: hypothetical protein LBF17_04285 [Mediterranea sp.]|jgi:hypothetical protein|nr:hypothetical protein [Mediterranea sp.]
MKKIFYLLILILSIVSCDVKNEVEIIKLHGESRHIFMPYMKMPYRVALSENYLVVFDLISDSSFYHVVSYDNLEYLYSLGKKGGGPNEITLSTPCQIRGTDLFVLDGAKSNIYKYKLTKKQAELVDMRKLPIPLTIDFVCKNDTVIIAEDLSGNNRLIEIAPSGSTGLFHIPVEENTGNIGHLWRSFMGYDSLLNKLALATQFGDVIEIYNLNNNSSKVIVGNEETPREKSQIEGYCDIQWSQGLIYALFLGRSKDKLNQNFFAGKKEPDGGNILKVFDEEGNLLRMYLLDCYINGFSIYNDQMIGVTSNNDEPLIFFSLNKNTLVGGGSGQYRSGFGLTDISVSQPVCPGNNLIITATYRAEKPEYFSKVLTVHANTKTPLRLTIRGSTLAYVDVTNVGDCRLW